MPSPWDRTLLEPFSAVGNLTLVPVRDTAKLNEQIAKCGHLPRFSSTSTAMGQPTSRSVDAAGIAYDVVEQRMRKVNDVVEHSYLQDVSAEVWPGAVIQGVPLTRGDTAVIGLPRAPGTLSIVTDIVTDSPQTQSVKVNAPTVASIGDARRELLQKLKPKDSAGILSTQFMRAYTLQEIGVKLGVDIRGSGYGVQVDASYDSTYKSFDDRSIHPTKLLRRCVRSGGRRWRIICLSGIGNSRGPRSVHRAQ